MKWATSDETSRYFQGKGVPESKIRIFDSLSVSALGMGTYLGAANDATDRMYEQNLLSAGLAGINFFDTSINYRCMRSERVLKKVIQELGKRGVGREQIVVATKGGFLSCDTDLESLDDYVRIHYLDTKIIQAKEIVAGCHCMSPAFLEVQIDQSLDNLGLESIDLYYLHNPELQLEAVGEKEFNRRLLEAFKLLERKVAEKKIQRYGLATWNGFRQKKGALQLAKIFGLAKEAGGEDHHFKAIELPYNLVMMEAIQLKNQSSKKTVAETAKELGIALMASAPLMQSQVSRLSRRVFEALPPAESRFAQSLEFVLSTPQFTTAFCGMKKKEHWEENKKILLESAWMNETWFKSYQALTGISPE